MVTEREGEVNSGMPDANPKPWRELTDEERPERLREILSRLEDPRQQEPVPRTTSEYWNSSAYLQRATVFAYCVLAGARPK